MSVLVCFVEALHVDVLGITDRVVDGGDTIKLVDNLVIYLSAPYVLTGVGLTRGWTVGNRGFSFKGGNHLVYRYVLVGEAVDVS